MVDDESNSDSDAEVCIAEWVETPKDWTITCPFIKPNMGKKEEVKYTLTYQSVISYLMYWYLGGGVIRLRQVHVVHSGEQLAKRKYCKWHDFYSHMTNECNYFRR
jgi:hypothetical protein